jgi:transposase
MNAYSLDLRKKIVEARERGMPTAEVAKTFGVGFSTVKRYAAAARQGRSLAPKKRPGSKPKLDEAARKLLEADLQERPAAALPQRREFLARMAGVSVSDSTISRMLGRMGWSRKKIGGCDRTRRVAEGRLEGFGGRRDRRGAPRFRGRDGLEHLTASAVRLVEAGRAGAPASVPRNWGRNVTLLSSRKILGMGPSMAVEGATTRAVFEAYVEEALCPSLSAGQVVVMDNLSTHKGGRTRELIEGRGCELLYLPPYSPDLNPIEQAFSKLKGLLRRAESRARGALIESMGAALSAITARDASGFFRHCGYHATAQLL